MLQDGCHLHRRKIGEYRYYDSACLHNSEICSHPVRIILTDNRYPLSQLQSGAIELRCYSNSQRLYLAVGV